MFKKRVEGIKHTDNKNLVFIPIAMLIVFTLIVTIATGAIGELIPNSNPKAMISVHGMILMILNVVITLFIISKFCKITMSELGFGMQDAFPKVILGVLSGFIAISVVAFTIKEIGGVTMIYSFKPENLTTILIGVVLFAFQGTFEEIVYRGYLLPLFTKKWGIVVATIVSSILFTILHAMNPGMTVMPVVNLMIASVVFSLVYYNWGSLWLAGFAHAVWNFSQGLIYGSLISGISVSGSVMKSLPVEGKTLLSGGNFGFEGSIVTSSVGIILIVVLSIIAKKKSQYNSITSSSLNRLINS